MAGLEALFAALEADPPPLIQAALERIERDEGKPTRITPHEVRFRPHGSLWINRRTGGWKDWVTGRGGGSWCLATEVAGMQADEIAALYGLDHAPLGPQDLQELRAAAERRQRADDTVEQRRRSARRQDAARWLDDALPASADNLAGRYLLARGLHTLEGAWFHPQPTIKARRGRLRHLAPSILFEFTDGANDLAAVHCVQLNGRTAARLTRRGAKLSIGSLMEAYVRFGPRSDVVCLGEGPETVASAYAVAPHWRCLACCSGLRLVDGDPDLSDAREIVFLTDRGAEHAGRETALMAAERWPTSSISMAHVPEQVSGDKADFNDALQISPDLVRQALSARQLEHIDASI